MTGTLLAQAQARGTTLDYVIIIAYFVGILGFGTFFGRTTRTTRDFFFGGQRFSWWLIGFSMVATGVGSYSFIKYSQKGFEYGMSSSMTYMNDWFFVPFFMFGWLPIIYFARVRSIPEYFQRRFDGRSRLMAVIILLTYLIAYIGYNIYTLGVAAHAVLGVNLYTAMVVITVATTIYVAVGGQTAVIFTDLAQGAMLLLAGGVLLLLGLDHLGMDGGIVAGLRSWWTSLDLPARLPFAGFARPEDFNFVGIFWQDGIASSITFLFINQGLIMRFLAAKSVNDGRKCILFNTVFLLPISAVVVSCAGWVGRAMVARGQLDPDTSSTQVFVTVAELVCHPGVFGFVLAALCAALMSTIDTLTNAVAALFVYDIYQPYIKKHAPDRHYLATARWVTLVGSGISLGLGIYFSFKQDLYRTHGEFIAAVTPPLVMSVFLGAFWKRYTPAAAFWSMFLGAALIYASKFFPALVKPIADLHGSEPAQDGTYSYITALFGLLVAGTIGIVISLFTKPKPLHEIAGLWIGSIDLGRRRFKGAEPDFQRGRPIKAAIRVSPDGTTPATPSLTFEEYVAHVSDQETPEQRDRRHELAESGQNPPEYPLVRLGVQDMYRLHVKEGDLLFVGDARRWLGGLRSLHCRAGKSHAEGNVVLMHAEAFRAGTFLPDRPVRVEKFF
ncbi:MAG TPA: sodium:solute symporter family protein [Phycisphaerae bacterium]|nr:sodium:solute symporter family protein [Phycisphaerae bacterium]HNU44645.1 sodium:solute symporter family protein [Phycisphaerae bacterium]